MPVGRIYQAPTVTIPRHTPVYGLHGIKSTASSQSSSLNTNDILVVKGKNVINSRRGGLSGSSGGRSANVSPDKKSESPQRPLHTNHHQHQQQLTGPPNLNSPALVRRSKSPSPLAFTNNGGENARSVRNGYHHHQPVKSRSKSREPLTLPRIDNRPSVAAAAGPTRAAAVAGQTRAANQPKTRLSPPVQNRTNGCSGHMRSSQASPTPPPILASGSSRLSPGPESKYPSTYSSSSTENPRMSPIESKSGVRVSPDKTSSNQVSPLQSRVALAVQSRVSPAEAESRRRHQSRSSREKSWSPGCSSDLNARQTSDLINNNTVIDNTECDFPADDINKVDTSINFSQQTNRNKNGTNIKAQDGGEVAGGTGGLKNLGNTCFMNSVIQCLSNTSLLVDYLLTDEYSKDINTTNSSMKGSLIKAFATLIKGIWKPGGRTLDPSSLKGAVQRFAPRFSGYNQEDSQEFLRYLLEGLHEDVNRVTSKPQPINTEIDSNLSVAEQSMEAWKRYLRRDDSKLVDIFVGQLKSTLRCSTCDFESVTFEPFWDLSLPIPARTGEVSLKDCLEAFTKEEIMDGDEMPTCERCKTRRRCSKFYTLYKLPKILVIHLKRFSPTERFRSKLGTTVTFPLTALDVAKFSDNPARSTYSCYAVSNHSGTLYSGHYTAYAKNPKSSEWHFFNDSRVSKSSSSNVISNEAYLLFFQLL